MLQIDYAILRELHNAGCIYISVTKPHTENIFKKKKKKLVILLLQQEHLYQKM